MVLAAIHSREAEYQEIGCLRHSQKSWRTDFTLLGWGPVGFGGFKVWGALRPLGRGGG